MTKQTNVSSLLPQSFPELKSAIETLQKCISKEPIHRQTSSLKFFGTIKSVAILFSLIFSDQTISLKRVGDVELKKAVELIRSYYPLIEKMKQGSKKEQNLAKLALEAINNYNTHLTKKNTLKWSSKIAEFIASKIGLSRLFKSTKKESFSEELSMIQIKDFNCGDNNSFCSIVKTYGVAKQRIATALFSPQERDMFRMKAIMLLRAHKIPVHTLDFTKSPIIGKTDKNGVLSLTQTMMLLPGEEIELKGKFQRKDGKKVLSIPLIDSFRLKSKTKQTGFPHPLQYSGWAFSDRLIPSHPHCPELLPTFTKLHDEKEKAAVALFPKGNFNQVAKEVLKLKKQTFLKHKNLFIPLHLQLSESILLASSKDAITNEDNKTLQQFFKAVEKSDNSYSTLSDTYNILKQVVIDIPCQELEKACYQNRGLIKSCQKNGHLPTLELIQKAAAQNTQKDQLTKMFDIDLDDESIDFIILMGKCLTDAASFILLQELSEMIGFTPLKLDSFSKKVQASAYKQVKSFINDLKNPPEDEQECFDRMLKQLQDDITLFSESYESQFPDLLAITNELESYYLNRAS